MVNSLNLFVFFCLSLFYQQAQCCHGPGCRYSSDIHGVQGSNTGHPVPNIEQRTKPLTIKERKDLWLRLERMPHLPRPPYPPPPPYPPRPPHPPPPPYPPHPPYGDFHRPAEMKKTTNHRVADENSDSRSKENKIGVIALIVTIVLFVLAITISYVTHQRRKTKKLIERRISQSLPSLEEDPDIVMEEISVNPSVVVERSSQSRLETSNDGLAMLALQKQNDPPPSYEASIQTTLQPPSYNETMRYSNVDTT
ncbi:uncharacterized protein [Clytia hemisphaerica]|uniref:Cnidarian restricted protein n=1 Tax=Clytia hemisphaerica TaxID=252671 RepID=A0A7M5X5G5_9CNID|eukprot:TCONS_00005931-protein